MPASQRTATACAARFGESASVTAVTSGLHPGIALTITCWDHGIRRPRRPGGDQPATMGMQALAQALSPTQCY